MLTGTDDNTLRVTYARIFGGFDITLHRFHQLLTTLGILLALAVLISSSVHIHHSKRVQGGDILALLGAMLGVAAGADIMYVIQKNNMQSLQMDFRRFIRVQETLLKELGDRDSARLKMELDRDVREAKRDANMEKWMEAISTDMRTMAADMKTMAADIKSIGVKLDLVLRHVQPSQ